jgi:Mg-chelatase subunit ChlD
VILDVLADELEDDEVTVEEAERIEALQGKMHSDFDDERLMHSVVENDDQTVKDGKLLCESVDYAMGSFTPDLMYNEIVENYKNAQRLFGPTIIRELTGYGSEYVEKNLKIAEFREDVKRNIEKNIDRLKKENLLDKDGRVTDEGLTLASLVLYTEELDQLETRGLGRKDVKERSHYGERSEVVPFSRHRYRDLDIRGSVLRAIRRGHASIDENDLQAVSRKQHGRISIVYALDASGSMRGTKITTVKKAGIALAYKAIQDKNDVGVVVFTSKVELAIPPTQDFMMLLSELTKLRAGQETDIALAIEHTLTVFERGAHTKHLILLTDGLPTAGKDPARKTLEAASAARNAGITISMIGINLEREGEQLARSIVEIGGGKLYRVTSLEDIDALVLEDYESLKA